MHKEAFVCIELSKDDLFGEVRPRGSVLGCCATSAQSPCARARFYGRGALPPQYDAERSKSEANVLVPDFDTEYAVRSVCKYGKRMSYQSIGSVYYPQKRAEMMGAGYKVLECFPDPM